MSRRGGKASSARKARGGARRTRARGRFLVVEGLDGAGTTTQARLVAEALRSRGREVHVTAEPSGGPVGALVRQVLTGRVGGGSGQGGFDPSALALLFAADRLDHAAAEIEPTLASGVDVVSDRFTLSSLAYQAVTTGDMTWIEALNARAPVPDLVVFLRARPAVALKRRRAAATTPELYEVDAFQREVARSYDLAIARLRAFGHRIVVLDGERPVEEVTRAVLAEVERLEGRARSAVTEPAAARGPAEPRPGSPRSAGDRP